MNGYGPASRVEIAAMIVRAWLRKEANQVIVGHVILAVVAIAMAALIFAPRG